MIFFDDKVKESKLNKVECKNNGRFYKISKKLNIHWITNLTYIRMNETLKILFRHMIVRLEYVNTIAKKKKKQGHNFRKKFPIQA